MTLDTRVEAYLLDEAAFRKFALAHVELAERWISDGVTESVMPHVAVLAKHDPDEEPTTHLHAMAVPFNTYAEKRKAMRGIGTRLHELEQIPMAVALFCECWMAPDVGGVKPKDHPDRREGLLVAATTLGHKRAGHWSTPLDRRRGKIVPARLVETKGEVTLPILEHVFRGFFDPVLARIN